MLSNQRFYRGSSMKATFHQGDLLFVEAALLSELRSGDVVVFARQCANCRKEIVHRVVRQVPGGIITRGDASAYEDAGMVTDHNLMGRVCYKTRGGRTRRVHGGHIGLWRGLLLHFYWGMRRRAVRIIQPFYGRLKGSGFIGRIWQPEITRVCVNTRDARTIQFLYKNRVIARYWPEQGRFECRKPWDLVIKDSSLIADLQTPSGGGSA